MRRTSGIPRRDFASFIDSFTPTSHQLGLLHTTSSYFLRDILEEEAIIPRECGTFKKPLCYCFYGKPSYRASHYQYAADMITVFPVTFILDPRKMPPPSHVYPFDTGAFASGAYSGVHDGYVKLEDFEMSSNLDAAQRLVSGVFGDNLSYFSSTIRPDFSPPIDHIDNIELLNFLQIVNGRRKRQSESALTIDDRAITVELAYDCKIDLKQSAVALILPDKWATAPRTGKRALELGIEIQPYNWQPNTQPNEYLQSIRDIVRHVFMTRGWL